MVGIISPHPPPVWIGLRWLQKLGYAHRCELSDELMIWIFKKVMFLDCWTLIAAWKQSFQNINPSIIYLFVAILKNYHVHWLLRAFKLIPISICISFLCYQGKMLKIKL